MLHYNFYESKNQSKQLLVMLHGFISDATTYHSHIERLVEHTNVLTIDLPGHGLDTSSMDEVWDFPFITRQLDEVLIQYQTYDVFLLGYSMGGRVALYYAIHGNETLSGLLLVSTSAGIQNETDKVERAQVDAARAKVLEIAGLDIFVNDWEKLPLFRSQYNLAPEIILVGEKDKKFVQIGQQLENHLQDSHKVQISNVGHTIHVEDSTEFDTIILGFLKEEQND